MKKESVSEAYEGFYAGTASGVEGFYRKQQAEAAASHWQLIQLAQTDRPGNTCHGSPMHVNDLISTSSVLSLASTQ